MYISLTDGQAVTMIWGWVIVSLISLSIAASLAEICVLLLCGFIEWMVLTVANGIIGAVYPTAGGVYYVGTQSTTVSSRYDWS